MTSSEIFTRRDFLWDKDILEWKIRSLGFRLVRKQDVAKGGGLEPKVYLFKVSVKFYCGGAGHERFFENFCNFWKKKSYFISTRSHFARFYSHLKELNF